MMWFILDYAAGWFNKTFCFAKWKLCWLSVIWTKRGENAKIVKTFYHVELLRDAYRNDRNARRWGRGANMGVKHLIYMLLKIIHARSLSVSVVKAFVFREMCITCMKQRDRETEPGLDNPIMQFGHFYFFSRCCSVGRYYCNLTIGKNNCEICHTRWNLGHL